MILGIDEVGRGPWAGPLVVGAVVLSDDDVIDGLTDSKKLSSKKRLALDVAIRERALGWGLGWVHAEELDAVGLAAALRLATIRAVESVKAPYHEIILDGTINFLKDTNKGKYVTTLAKADLLIPAVSAASIIAKVARDTYMIEQDRIYPEYGFASHVGYGTAKHVQALSEHGITPLHRQSFAPIARIVGGLKGSEATGNSTVAIRETSTSLGSKAEEQVAALLTARGMDVTQRNWKTKWCEIDIVAESEEERYFVEVKYRSSQLQGGGKASITPKKVQKIRFAAELYAATFPTPKNVQLIVATVDDAGKCELLQLE